MKSRIEFTNADEPNRPRKSPMHLLLLPVAFGVMGGCSYMLVRATVSMAVAARPEIHSFSSYGELSKTLIVLPMLFASIPLGFIAADFVAWGIPPLRRHFERDAKKVANGDFKHAIAGLLALAKYGSFPLIVLSAGVSLFGR